MKITIASLFVALVWNVAATQTIDYWLFNDSPRNIFLASPASGHWATLSRYDCPDPYKSGYDPHGTVLYSSWKPVVKEVAPNRWQVTFISPDQNNP